MSLVHLGLGSNSGDSEAILAGALAELSAVLSGLRSSSVYRTSPRYVLDQADFLNIVVRGETDLAPEELLSRAQAIEARFGRDRSRERRKGPRTLDIDVLLYGELVVETPELSIPHPGMAERAFVLAPLEEVSPGLRHPVSGEAFATYLAAAAGQGIYLHAGPPV